LTGNRALTFPADFSRVWACTPYLEAATITPTIIHIGIMNKV